MTVDDDGTIWVPAHEVQAGDVEASGAKVLSTTLVADSFVKITIEWGDTGRSFYPGKNQLFGLRSVVTD